MDQETAKNLYEAGGMLVFLDVPENTEFGIDYNCWRTGNNFKGVKMIPPGIHFIYYSVCDRHGSLGFRNGFFYNFKQSEIVLKKWNKQDEMIDERPCSEDEIENLRINKHDLDRYLGAYPYDEYKRWISLTNHLNDSMLNRLLPLNRIISSGSVLVGEKFSKGKKDKDTQEAKSGVESLFKVPETLKEAESLLPTMKENEHTIIRFTKIPDQQYPKGSTAAQITIHSIDLSYKLESMLTDNYESRYENLLCELQFAFICFLIGQVYDAFEQWKALVILLSNAEKTIFKCPKLYIEFIQTIYFHIKEIPEDFFTDIVSKNNFLVTCLHNLFDNINSIEDNLSAECVDTTTSDIKKLKEKSIKFKNYLEERFKFDFEEEPDEYAPVICGGDE